VRRNDDPNGMIERLAEHDRIIDGATMPAPRATPTDKPSRPQHWTHTEGRISFDFYRKREADPYMDALEAELAECKRERKAMAHCIYGELITAHVFNMARRVIAESGTVAGMDYKVDPDMPPDEIHFRDASGKLVGRMTGVGAEKEKP